MGTCGVARGRERRRLAVVEDMIRFAEVLCVVVGHV